MKEELFNTKNEVLRKIQSNILFVALVELTIYTAGLRIKYFFQYRGDIFTPILGAKYGPYYNSYFWLFIPIALLLAFMWLTCRGAMSVFTEGTLGRKLRSLGKGLVIGFALSGVLALLAGVTNTVKFSFNAFEPLIVPLFFFLFIQCASEEVLLRGYVPAILEKEHSWDAVAFVSGALFIFHHELNMTYYGFNSIFCLNVFLLGVFFYLLVRVDGNFWIACGFHTAWNYMEDYILGLSNSGETAEICIFKGANSAGNFFYDYVYGFEASLSTTILIGAAIIFLICKMSKRS